MPAAIPLAMIGGSLISGAISSHSANTAAKAQGASNDKALDFEKQRDTEDRAQFDATQRANYNQYLTKYNAARQLGGEYGLNLPDAQPYQSVAYAGQPGQPAQGQPASQPASTGAGAAELKALLDKGLDPKAAVSQFNQQYGRSTGNEAVYYDPSAHGGVATIGLPDAYLAKPGASWDITQRSGGGAAPRAPIASPISSYLAAGAPQMPSTPDFKLRSINAFM